MVKWMITPYQKLWLAALAAFIVAGSTGAFLRFGVLYGMAGLNYVNVRRTHSPPMYFAWVTPALKALMAKHRMRVPYLHWLLLGFATLLLFCIAEREGRVRGRRRMTGTVILLTITLISLTGLRPPALSDMWTLHAAAWAALGPVVVAIAVLLRPYALTIVAAPPGVARLE